MDGSFFKLTKNGDRMVIIKKEKFTSEKSVLYVKNKQTEEKKVVSEGTDTDVLNNDINCLANDRDYTDSLNENYNFIKNYLLKEYTIYEKIINLCDLMCTTKLQTVEKRMIDLLLRHGVYKNTHYHLIETLKLKKHFDDLLGYNLYDLFPEMKENL